MERAATWTGDHEESAPPLARLAARAFALHDVLLLGYLAAVATLVALAPAHPQKGESLRATVATMGVLTAAAILTRATTAGKHPIAAWAYRTTVAAVVVVNYLVLQQLLPVVRHDTLDAALARLDAALFGVQPAVWLEPLTTPAVVETFAFFYFSYFVVAGAFVVGTLWVARRGRFTTEWAIGTVLVYCVGQLGYMAVPGFGPVVHLAGEFTGPLRGGFFWSCVQDAVAAGGAQKDVFPSLHTAAPVWFALHAARRSRFEPGWRLPAAVGGFFAAMIVLSTVILRWHYVVDVLAGLGLAVGVATLAPHLARWSERARGSVGGRPAFADGSDTSAAAGQPLPAPAKGNSRLDPSDNPEQAPETHFLPAGAMFRWQPRLGKTSSRGVSPRH